MATTTAPLPGLTGPASAANSAGGALTTTGASAGVPAAPRPSLLAKLFEPTGPFGPVRQVFDQPAVKKALPFMILALVLMLFVGIYTAINAPTYRSISAGMNEADSQAAMEALKAGDFKPQLDANNGQITVQSGRYHEARIFLASKGIPKTAPVGLETLKEQSAMTTSQFMEQVRYTAAIEQELAKSITHIQSIQAARVHLALPKQSAFVRDRTPPKASVVITPHPGRYLTPSQVQAIVNLVASSVPMLATENVSVVDNNGKLVTESLRDFSRKAIRAQYASLDDFLRRWKTDDRKDAIIAELAEEGLLLDPLLDEVGKDLDPFDLICHIAFDQPPLTRRERANNVKKRDVFTKYGPQARAVLEALLSKYQDEGVVGGLDNVKMLEIPPFNSMGTPFQLIKQFGTKAGFEQAVHELQAALYQEVA